MIHSNFVQWIFNTSNRKWQIKICLIHIITLHASIKKEHFHLTLFDFNQVPQRKIEKETLNELFRL